MSEVRQAFHCCIFHFKIALIGQGYSFETSKILKNSAKFALLLTTIKYYEICAYGTYTHTVQYIYEYVCTVYPVQDPPHSLN